MNRKVINGGWHDAADLSQGYWRTAMGVYALLSNLELIRKDKALAELSERSIWKFKWGMRLVTEYSLRRWLSHELECYEDLYR